jgi:hypothetical protein
MSETPTNVANSGHTDIGALSAAVVAVAVAMLVTPGPYDTQAATVGLVVLAVLFGYVWETPRKPRQSLAVAAVVGLITLPISGFAMEVAHAEQPWLLIEYGNLVPCPPRECHSMNEFSTVNELTQVKIWFTTTLLVLLADRLRMAWLHAG